MDQAKQDRTEAFQWLLEDPEKRAIVSPNHVAALFLMYDARASYPEGTFSIEQFPAANDIHKSKRMIRSVAV